ncbi:MAG TPA: hypothetical protein PLD23_09045 [Armatimonadota bacterium]|nr:hypothetical protein [Armatimonadota bacterium]HQK93640.1 hypothetical protein [Armatimonadota bacterium]
MAKKDIADQCLCKAIECSAKLNDLRGLVRDAQYICKKCGRAAAKKRNLCSPVKLYSEN